MFESQLPLYFAEKANGTLRLAPEETVYTLWIGTNDLGANALLTGETNGATVVDAVTCAVNWVKTLYLSGARNFLFQNVSGPLALKKRHTHAVTLADDTSTKDHLIFSRLLPEPVLDRRAKHDDVEHYDG